MMQYNFGTLRLLIPSSLSENEQTGWMWILHLVNRGETVLYSKSNGPKKAIIDAIVKEEILILSGDQVKFSDKFQAFMAQHQV